MRNSGNSKSNGTVGQVKSRTEAGKLGRLFFWGLNELIYEELLRLHMAHINQSINVSWV